MQRKLIVLAAIGLLVLPGAGATWMAYGSYEPDTYLDVPAFMFHDAPVGPSTDIYFNGYYTWGDSGNNGAYVNPNVGALQTNIGLAGPIYWEALFGVWTDCNMDGYVGMLETAVREYSANILLDDSVCPPVTGSVSNWPGGNNYNGWVTELIPIANAKASNADRKVYRDNSAMVWAERGRPDDAAAISTETPCAGRARGDAQTTGGLIYWFDCQGNNGYVDQFNEIDATLGLGLGFGDDPRTSSSPLNQPTFGSDSSDASAVHLQECNADPLLETGDQSGDDLDDIAILRPAPSNPVNTDVQSWTVPGTMNETAETIYAPENTWGPDSTSNCDFEDDPGQDFYIFLEGTVDVPAYDGKDAVWRNFRFQTASRGTIPANVIRSGSTGASTDLGITALGVECGPSSCFESGWFGGTDTYVTPTVESRVDLVGADVGADLARAPYYTFYAHVHDTKATLGIPGGAGIFGFGQCGEARSGTLNGWNCDPDAWYLLSDGTQNEPGENSGVWRFARIGDAYEFRDVDCYDGWIGELGMAVEPSGLGPEPCRR